MIRALVHLVSQLFPCLPWMSVSDSSSAAALRGLSSKPPSVPMLIEGCGVETSEEPPDLIVFEAEIDSWLDDIKTPVLEPERPVCCTICRLAPRAMLMDSRPRAPSASRRRRRRLPLPPVSPLQV